MKYFIMVALVAIPCSSIPAPKDIYFPQNVEVSFPQDVEPVSKTNIQPKTKTITETIEEKEDRSGRLLVEESNGDNGDGVMDLLKFGVDFLKNLLALKGDMFNFFLKLLADQEFTESIGDTVDASLNLTGQLTRAAIPLATGVIEQVPRIVEQGSKLAGSLVRASQETAPLVIERVTDTLDQLPLIVSFATSYAEVNAEQSEFVAQTFVGSLQCDLRCGDLTDSLEKEECEAEYCKKVEKPDDEYEV